MSILHWITTAVLAILIITYVWCFFEKRKQLREDDKAYNRHVADLSRVAKFTLYRDGKLYIPDNNIQCNGTSSLKFYLDNIAEIEGTGGIVSWVKNKCIRYDVTLGESDIGWTENTSYLAYLFGTLMQEEIENDRKKRGQ